jgi:hypothetical protein
LGTCEIESFMEKLGTRSPWARLQGAWACPEPGYEEEDLVWGAIFLSHLPREGTDRIRIVGS